MLYPLSYRPVKTCLKPGLQVVHFQKPCRKPCILRHLLSLEGRRSIQLSYGRVEGSSMISGRLLYFEWFFTSVRFCPLLPLPASGVETRFQ